MSRDIGKMGWLLGIGRTHARTHIIDTGTGEILRHLTLNPNHDYQPQQHKETPEP